MHKTQTVLYLVLKLIMLNSDISSLENSVDPDQLASYEASWSGSTVFQAASESTVLTEIKQLNWLENRSECAMFIYSARQG